MPGPNSHYAKGDDAELEALMAAMPPKKEEDYAIETQRKTVGMFLSKAQPLVPGVKVTEVQIPVDDPKGEILIKIYTPETAASGLPLLVWYHGGGFVIGHPNMDDTQCSKVVATHGMVVMSIDYRLAPEFPFPTAIKDSFAALKWAVANASHHGAAPDRGLLVGGASAGGNISAVMAILARDDPSFQSKITGQLLIIPAVCYAKFYPDEYKSELTAYYESENFTGLNKRQVDSIVAIYGVPDPSDIRFSPLLAPLQGLPKAVIQVHGADPLRDDGIVYSKALQKAGVENKLYIYPGALHGFHMMFPTTVSAKKHANDTEEGIKWLLLD